MARSLVLIAALAIVSTVSATQRSYQSAKIGEFVPPPAPAKESAHLEKLGVKAGERIPAPVSNRRNLLQTNMQGMQQGLVKKVPHNWFGTGRFIAPVFGVATGEQECKVCKKMIETKRSNVNVDQKLANPPPCKDMAPAYMDMCQGYRKYLEECPSFVHNICHEDVGGSEKLLSPCPDHLVCYYCLRVNPLYCLTD
jgi:hypothetical protein